MTGHQTWKFDCIDQNSSLSLPIVTNEKNSNFILQNQEKKRGLCKRSAKELLFEWQYHRISSRDLSGRVINNLDMKWSRSERDN